MPLHYNDNNNKVFLVAVLYIYTLASYYNIIDNDYSVRLCNNIQSLNVLRVA